MNKINYEIYIIAMVELMINGNSGTDLGSNYVLEYSTPFDSVGGGDMSDGDACLVVAARLRNKTTNSIEWGNLYYKRLISNSSPWAAEVREKLEKMLCEINEKSEEEKLKFILKPENIIFKTPYTKSGFVPSELAPFFPDLQYMQWGDYPAVSLNGKFPKEAVPHLEVAFNDIIAKLQNPSSNKIKQYH